MSELKPCPFCGGCNIGIVDSDIDVGLYCRDCGVKTRTCYYPFGTAGSSTYYKSLKLAKSIWNTRAPSVEDIAHRLKKAIKKLTTHQVEALIEIIDAIVTETKKESRAQAIDELKPMIKRFMLFAEDSYSTNDEYYIQAKKLLEGNNHE